MFERLSLEYNQGYTKAILDIAKVVTEVNVDLIVYKRRWNYSTISSLVSIFLENREKVRDGRPGFIRWNVQKKSLEWFDGK